MFTGRHHFSLFKLCCHLPAALNQASRVCEPSVPPLGLGGLTDTDKRHSTRPAVLGKVCATGLPLNIRGSTHWDFPGGTVDKNAPANAGDTGSIPDPGWSIPHAEEQLKPMSHNYPTPQFKSINSSALSFLHSPTLTSIHDHWKNHSLD